MQQRSEIQPDRPPARILFGVIMVMCGALAIAAAEPRTFEKGVLIRFEGVITPMSEQYLYRKLDHARRHGADLIVVEIESPGGYLESSLDISARLRNLNWAHTAAYVPDEALSGAAIMSLGCDEIVMGPLARIGDAGPVFQGEDALFRHAPEKIRTDLVRRVRDLAEAKGRPPALAEAMVDPNLLVYEFRNRETLETSFMSRVEKEATKEPDAWEEVGLLPDSREGLFLELNGTDAVKFKLADATVENRGQLRELFGVDSFLVLEPGGVDTAVFILNLPLVTGLLLVFGLVALYVELSAPGISVGGIVGGLCFALFFWSRFLGGTAGVLEVILFAAGIVFLLVEFFVLPGFGVAGLLGAVSLLTSLVLASQTFVIPSTSGELSTFTVTLLVVVSSVGAFLAAAMLLASHFGKIPVLNRLRLEPPSLASAVGKTEAAEPPVSSRDASMKVSVGDRGVAESPLRPAGKAVFGEKYIDVVTDGSYVEPGCRVRVLRISGNHVVVREIDETS